MANSGQPLYPRIWKLTIGTYDLSRLRVTFKVKSSLKPEPNTADVSVYNLSDNHRAAFEVSGPLVMRLQVGYGQNTHQIFLGEVRTCFTEVQGPDKITKFASGDGEQAILGTRIRVTYGNQVQIGTCIQDIANVLGVGAGNLSYAVSQLQNRGLTSIYPRGIALSGNAWKELTTICTSCGLECTIQDGALLILEQGQALAGDAVRLASDSGLEGSPTADNDGTVNCVARLIPELRPGCKVQIESFGLGASPGLLSRGRIGRGVFRIYDAEYAGDTHGGDWNVSLGCQKINNAVVQLQEVVV